MNIHALRQRDKPGRTLKQYDQILQICTGDGHATVDTSVDWVHRLVDEFQIPRLGTYGIKSEHVDELVRKATHSSSLKVNPVVLTPEELAEALRQTL